MSTSDPKSSKHSGWFDSHCHLTHLTDYTSSWNEANRLGINSCFIPATESAEWHYILKLQSESIAVGVGTHPWYVKKPSDEANKLESALADHRINAVGEIGLDFYPSERKPRPEKTLQLESFQRQLSLAMQFKKPVVIHEVKAHQEVLKILKSSHCANGVIHAFSGSYEIAKAYVDQGFCLGIGPHVMRSNKLQAAVKQLPRDRILLETDAPYMAIQKGENPLIDLLSVARSVATLWGESEAVVQEQTTSNAASLFFNR